MKSPRPHIRPVPEPPGSAPSSTSQGRFFLELVCFLQEMQRQRGAAGLPSQSPQGSTALVERGASSAGFEVCV